MRASDRQLRFDEPVHQHRQFGEVEGTVGVGEADDVRRGRLQPGVDRGAVAAPGFVDDLRPEPGRHFGGVVGGAVVDHDRPVARGQGRQHPRKGTGLVEARKHDVNLVIVHALHAKSGMDGRKPLLCLPNHDVVEVLTEF